MVSYSFERIGKLLEERELRLVALQKVADKYHGIIHEPWFNKIEKLACLRVSFLTGEVVRGIRSHRKEGPEIPVHSKNQGDGHNLRNAA